MTATSIAYADLLARTRGVFAVVVLFALGLWFVTNRRRGAASLRESRLDVVRRLADDLAEVIGG